VSPGAWAALLCGRLPWRTQHPHLPPSPRQTGPNLPDLPTHAPASCRKPTAVKPSKPKASASSTSPFLFALLSLVASPLVLPPWRGWSRRENSAPPFPSRCPARNPPMNRNSCSLASSSPLQEPRGGSCLWGTGEEASPRIWLPWPPSLSKSAWFASAGLRKKSLRSQLAQLESKSHRPARPSSLPDSNACSQTQRPCSITL